MARKWSPRRSCSHQHTLDNAMNNDNNPRPHKRQRTQLTENRTDAATPALPPLPPPVLLLSLPGLLAHPPTHRFHPQALILSLKSLRKCLTLESLAPDVECRTWTALAEVGMNAIDGGFAHKPEHTWAIGIEKEVGSLVYLVICALC